MGQDADCQGLKGMCLCSSAIDTFYISQSLTTRAKPTGTEWPCLLDPPMGDCISIHSWNPLHAQAACPIYCT